MNEKTKPIQKSYKMKEPKKNEKTKPIKKSYKIQEPKKNEKTKPIKKVCVFYPFCFYVFWLGFLFCFYF